MVVIICGKYGNNRSRIENFTERTRFSKSRSNDLEDIVQGQRSSHATHLLMLVIICIKYGKNRSRTVDATERTRFFKAKAKWPWRYRSRSKVIICNTPSHTSGHCAKYGKNPSRTVDFFFKVNAKKFQNFANNSNFQILKKRTRQHTL